MVIHHDQRMLGGGGETQINDLVAVTKKTGKKGLFFFSNFIVPKTFLRKVTEGYN